MRKRRILITIFPNVVHPCLLCWVLLSPINASCHPWSNCTSGEPVASPYCWRDYQLYQLGQHRSSHWVFFTIRSWEGYWSWASLLQYQHYIFFSGSSQQKLYCILEPLACSTTFGAIPTAQYTGWSGTSCRCVRKTRLLGQTTSTYFVWSMVYLPPSHSYYRLSPCQNMLGVFSSKPKRQFGMSKTLGDYL